MNLTFGSVCSGIDAASAAWNPLGWRASWFAEIEAFPSAVLAHHYPDVPNLGDMTKIPAMIRAGAVAAPDALVGGTPCQGFSIAGLRKSLGDPRGQLSLSFVDLANAIDTARLLRGKPAAIIVWENVPGVLNTKDNAFGCFLGALAGEDCPLEPAGGKWTNAGCVFGPQRTVAWRVTDAQYFGVAQRRRRVFVVASARDGVDPAAVLFEREGVRRDTAPSREAGQSTTHATAPCLTSSGRGVSRIGETRGQDPVVAVAFGGNNTAGSIDVATARNACGSGSGRLDFETETFLVQARSVALRGRDGGATAELGDEVAGCLRASGGGGDKAHVLAPAFIVESPPCTTRLAGPIAFDSRQECVSSTDVFGALGSSSPQAQAICITGDITHTLKAEGFDASEDGTGRGQPIVATDVAFTLRIPSNGAAWRGDGADNFIGQGMAVRRLTPRECERLQGFPDDYTLVPGRMRTIRPEKLDRDYIKYLARGGAMTFEQCCTAAADGPRYKALGNSMCVENMAWIGRRIESVMECTA